MSDAQVIARVRAGERALFEILDAPLQPTGVSGGAGDREE